MKINNNPKKHSSQLIPTVLTVVILTLGLAAAACFWLASRPSQKDTDSTKTTDTTNVVNYDAPTDEQKKAGTDIKTSTQQPPTTSDISAVITSANVNGDIVQIRAIINGAVSGTGTCTLALTNAGTVVTKTAATYAAPSSSTCAGFDINRSELPNKGIWDINLTVTVGSNTASATKKITLE